MSGLGAGGGEQFSRPGAHEPVGSVGEEAAKLLAALQGWAREHAGDHSRGAGEPGDAAGSGEGAGSRGLSAPSMSDGSAACRICPLCQLIALARGINPESLEHVGHAASTLLHTLADLVDSAGRSHGRRGAPVQKIDLTDDPEDPTWG